MQVLVLGRDRRNRVRSGRAAGGADATRAQQDIHLPRIGTNVCLAECDNSRKCSGLMPDGHDAESQGRQYMEKGRQVSKGSCAGS